MSSFYLVWLFLGLLFFSSERPRWRADELVFLGLWLLLGMAWSAVFFQLGGFGR